MYKKILGMLLAMFLVASAAFAVDVGTNETVASSSIVASITYTCTDANGLVLKLTPSVATAGSKIHYAKNGVASMSSTSVTAGSFVLADIDLGGTFSMVSSEAVAFVMLTIPKTNITATTTVVTQALVASTVALVTTEPVKFNMAPQPGSPSLFLKYSVTDFATNTVGTNVQGGSTVGFDVASGSIVTMFSSTGIINYAYGLPVSKTASYSANGTEWFGAVSSVINFTGTEPVSLLFTGATANCFVVKNASATVTSPTMIPTSGTYTVELFTGDYLSLVSTRVGYTTMLGRVAGGASAPLVIKSRQLTKTFASSNVRTFTFRNDVPKRISIIPASQTVFIEINGTASTSSTLKATPTNSLVKRLKAGDTVSVVATAPISLTIRSVPIGR